MYVIACAFRQGVALVEKFFYWALFTSSWDPLSGTWSVQGDDAPTRLMCGLDITFVNFILYKIIVIKFFWDYGLNSRVCNYGKRIVIGLLRAVIKCFTFIF